MAAFYPWQLYTRALGLPMNHALPPRYDVARLQAECRAIVREFHPQPHFSHHHDGGWTAISLISKDGDPFEGRELDGEYRATPALGLAPYIEGILNDLGEFRRVRLLALGPGEAVHWHFDRTLTLDRGMARLHLPIITSPLIDFQISHANCRWLSGRLYYGDFSFPHRVYNAGTETRIHLVADIVADDSIRALFPPAYLSDVPRRDAARARCHRMLRWWNRVTGERRRQVRAKVARGEPGNFKI